MIGNMPGFNVKPITLIDEDPKTLVADMFHTLERMAIAAYAEYERDPIFGPIIQGVETQLLLTKSLAKEFRRAKRLKKQNPGNTDLAEQVEQLGTELLREKRHACIGQQLLTWCRQLPVFGFNSGKLNILILA